MSEVAATPAAPAPQKPRSGGAALLVAAGILLSRIAGLIRQRVLGYYLATSPAADAYTAALRIPNFLQNLLGEGVLSASFIPVYAALRARGEEGKARRVAGAVAGLLSAAPQRFVTRTQYDVGANNGGVMSCAALPLAAGWEVSPRGPSYQTIVSGCEPVRPA